MTKENKVLNNLRGDEKVVNIHKEIEREYDMDVD